MDRSADVPRTPPAPRSAAPVLRDDPRSRFRPVEWEPDLEQLEGEELPRLRVQVFEESPRSILSENDSPDVPFRYSVNPYRGCRHACAYCYARPTHEYLGLGAGSDFEHVLVVKVGADRVLDAELRKRSLAGETVAFSGVTDCYQPLESRYRLTRSCLEVCERHDVVVSVVTKSSLVVRDRDVLQRLAEQGRAEVFVSIPFLDAERARAVEPGAPSPQRRLDAVRALREAGVPVGVLVSPLIPGLNDVEAPAVLRAAAEAGAEVASWTALRLPGSVEEVFHKRLESAFPDRWSRIESKIRAMRGGALNDTRFGHRMTGEGHYFGLLDQLLEREAARLGLTRRDQGGAGERLAFRRTGGAMARESGLPGSAVGPAAEVQKEPPAVRPGRRNREDPRQGSLFGEPNGSGDGPRRG